MTNISKTFSIDPGRPIDLPTKDALIIIDRVMRKMNVKYFIAGAQARELVLHNIFGVNTGGATVDIDFGICVDSWDTFIKAKEALIATGLYKINSSKMQRLEHTSTGLPIDLLPFGGVEQKDGTIIWPQDMERIMTVAGFDDALRSSISVKIDGSLSVPIASLPALVTLKLFAWVDRRAFSQKDAKDIWLILDSYQDIVRDRIFEVEKELFLESNYNIPLASIKLLGKEIVHLCEPNTLAQLRENFSNNKSKRQLIEDIVSQRPRFDNEEFVKQVESYISAFFETIEI